MRKMSFLILVFLLSALVPAVLAGGWAVVTLDDMPGEIRAGEPWAIGFTVLQHGQTPVHRLDANSFVEPLLVAENPATGQRLEIMATPDKEVGHFVAEVTFPSEGAWTWTIYPNPLASETLFEPLTVLPAAVAPAASLAEPAGDKGPIEVVAPRAVATTTESDSGFAMPALLRWGALIVALAAVVLFVIQNRRRAQPAGVES